MATEREHEIARRLMVERQLRARNISDQRVLAAMGAVPRHLFVPADMRQAAYADGPLPIGQRQTISQPYIVAYMTQLLQLAADDRVLEIGTGSGYQAAVLAQLAAEVISLERHAALAASARQVLADLGLDNVDVIQEDGSGGYPPGAPYDAIIVTAAAPEAPQPLKEQLADGGRLVLPVGGRGGQILERWTRRGAEINREQLVPVAFVPLVGEHGWQDEDDPDWGPSDRY